MKPYQLFLFVACEAAAVFVIWFAVMPLRRVWVKSLVRSAAIALAIPLPMIAPVGGRPIVWLPGFLFAAGVFDPKVFGYTILIPNLSLLVLLWASLHAIFMALSGSKVWLRQFSGIMSAGLLFSMCINTLRLRTWGPFRGSIAITHLPLVAVFLAIMTFSVRRQGRTGA